MSIKRIALLCLAITTSGIVSSANATAPGAYMGLIAGESNAHNKTQNVQTGVQTVTPTSPPVTVPVSPSNSGMAGGFIIGYAFNPYGAFELGATHYASSTYKKPSDSQLNHDSVINTNSVDLAMKGSVPFKAVSLFGKIGAIYVSTSASGSLQPVTVQPSGKVLNAGSTLSNNVVRPMLAAGVSYDITQNWVTDVTFTTFTGGGGVQGIDLVTLGVSYHFVDLMCGQFLC